MQTICNEEQFMTLLNEKFLLNVNNNTVKTFSFNSILLLEMKKSLQKLIDSEVTPSFEAYRAVISAQCISLWIDDISKKKQIDISLRFYWDCDELAFDVSSLQGQKIWFSRIDSLYSTSFCSKKVIFCIISFLRTKGVSIKLEDYSECGDDYIDQQVRDAISVFVNGKKDSYPCEGDRLVKNFCLL